MTAKCVAIFGTASDVGKSITAAALCRIFKQKGFQTAPFKAQNMSNNAWVVPGLGEIARAQVVQAEAAGVVPHPDMNPVLLKPNTETGAQVVVRGRVVGNRTAHDYFQDTSRLAEMSHACLQRLREKHELIVIEGAGSCAEVNLRATDFVNFETAHAADCPVILVADIDRGGVFAQVVGTLEVLPERDRARVAGIIINRFRGDARLFDDGITWLEQRTGLSILGVIPYFRHIHIESEDGLTAETALDPPSAGSAQQIKIGVVRLPHIANFTDFSPLWREPGVNLHYLSDPNLAHAYDMLILPGSKNVRDDLRRLRSWGWVPALESHARAGKPLLGVCGGYQILGQSIADPHGVEGQPGTSEGLGLLPIITELAKEKIVRHARGFCRLSGAPIQGYEIHMGRTQRLGGEAAVAIEYRDAPLEKPAEDGTRVAHIWGTYLHGLFESAPHRKALLRRIQPDFQLVYGQDDPDFRDQQYDLLAQHFAKHLNMERLNQIILGI